MAYQIQVRSDIANNWTGANPILAQGEPGYETDTLKLKYGDGTTPWNSLPYFSAGGGGNGSPGGSNTQIQFNDNGSFAGSPNLTWDGLNLAVTGNVDADYLNGNIVTDVSNLQITGGTNGYFLQTDGLGNLTWSAAGGGGNGSPGGSNTQIQFNNAGLFAGSTNLTWDGSTLNVIGNITASNINGNANNLNLTGFAGDIIPASNNTQSLGNVTNQWKDLWVGNATIYIDGIPLSVTSGNVLTFDGSPIVTTTSNSSSAVEGNINITGDVSSNTVVASNSVQTFLLQATELNVSYLSGDGSNVSNIQYSNIDGAYTDDNVAVFLSSFGANDITTSGNITASYFFGNVAFATGFPALDNYSNANVANYLPIDPTIISIQNDVSNVNSNVIALTANVSNAWSEIGNIDSNVASLSANVSNAWVAINNTDSNVTILSANVSNAWSAINNTDSNVTILSANVSNAWSEIGNINSNVISLNSNVSNTDSNVTTLSANVSNAWSAISNTDSNVTTLSANVSNAWSEIGNINNDITALQANAYSNANVAAYLNTYSGNVSADNVSGNSLIIGNISVPGEFFIESTANSLALGQTGAQTLSFTGNGIQLAGTGGVSIQGAAGATVSLGGGTTGSILVYSPITLGDISNVHINGGTSGQILATDGAGNLYWTNDTTAYGNADVANYLPIYGGNIAVDFITVTGNVDAGNNYFIGNGALLTGLDAASGYSNANVEALLPVYSGNINANIVNANIISDSISSTGNVTANFFIGDGSQLTNLPILDAYSNANVANYLPIYNGNILASTITSSSVQGNTVTAGIVTANNVTVSGNVQGNILVTPNNRVGTPRANGNTDKITLFYIPGNWNYALGTDSSHMWFAAGGGSDGFSWYTGGNLVMQSTGPDLFVEGEVTADTFTACSVVTTATVSTDNLIANAVLSVDASFSGNIAANTGNIQTFIANSVSADTGDIQSVVANTITANTGNIQSVVANSIVSDTIVANSVTTAYDVVSIQTTANTIILGNANVAVNQISWVTASSNTTSNVTLFSENANNISSIDFDITATSGNNRQVSKILAVTLGNNFNYTEYGSLSIGSLIGNFFVDVISGNLVLQVQPFTSANVHYSIIMDYDFDLHLTI